jgi:hypothetical protein
MENSTKKKIIIAIVMVLIVLGGIVFIMTKKPAVKKYRYVRVWRKKNPEFDSPGIGHPMNLAEIEVISGNTNVALNKTVTASSALEPPGNFTNGNTTDIAHTMDGEEEWLLVDLGKEYTIDKIMLYNRQNCCQYRAQDIVIQLSSNKDMSNRIESNLITKEQAVKMKFTWVVPSNKTITAE